MLKRTVLLALAVLFSPAGMAGEILPSYLIGSWGTAESLWAGTTGQTDMYVQADGYGAMAGSTPPAQRVDGVDDGKRAPRAIIGFPIEATMDGDVLMVRPVLPAAEKTRPQKVMVMTCRHDAAGATLTCTGPDGKPIVMKWRGETIPDEILKGLAEYRKGIS